MKRVISCSVFILAFPFFLAGCSTTSTVRPYMPSSTPSEIQKGVVFSLPKTILEATITYSLYEMKVWASDPQGNPKKTDKDGKPVSPKSTSKVVVVDKPIQVLTRTIADPSMRFIFDVDSLNGFSKSTDITLELTNNGLIKTSNTVVQDKTKEIISNATGTFVNLAKIAAVAGTDVAELVLEKDVAVSRIIDPSDLKFTAASNKYSATYTDSKKAEAFFDSRIAVPKVTVIFYSDHDISQNIQIKSDNVMSDKKQPGVIHGLPYRTGYPLRVTVSVDDREIYDQFHMFAQAGEVAIIPVNAKVFSDITQGLSFSEDGAYLTKYASKGTSVGESVSAVAKDTTGSTFTGITDVKQTKIDKLKKDKELLDLKNGLNDQAYYAEAQAKIDKLKKEKELIDAETALADSKKKQSESLSK